MPRKKFSPDQVFAKLRQVEVLTAQGHSVDQASRETGINEQSYYRWTEKSVRPPDNAVN